MNPEFILDASLSLTLHVKSISKFHQFHLLIPPSYFSFLDYGLSLLT